ncbi:hypothetical protein LNQ03_31520 [Klebsiella pneumoniae subsp. pneumoniae]|nr:hypothetical protein [Klebsiella pneumoniae subsp. pneumoniae]
MITVLLSRTRRKETTATTALPDSDGYPLGKTTTAKGDLPASPPTLRQGSRKEVDYTAIGLQRSRCAGHGASDLRLRRSRQSGSGCEAAR